MPSVQPTLTYKATPLPSVEIYLTDLQRKNLVVNPSFETNTTGWSVTGSTTVARSTAQFFDGVASGLVTLAASSFQGIFSTARLPVTAGLPYQLSAYVRDINSAVNWRVAAVFYNALTGGSQVGSTAAGTSAAINSSGWTRLTATVTPPATATHAAIFVTAAATPVAGTQAYVDAVMFEQDTVLNHYYAGTALPSTTPTAVTIYRQVDGETTIVRGANNAAASGAFLVNDFEAPFGKPVTYWAETFAGSTSQGLSTTSTITLNVGEVWIHDPLDLTNAMAIYLDGDNDATLGQGSFSEIARSYDYNRTSVLGRSRPVLQFYGEKAIQGLEFNVLTKPMAGEELRDLLSVAPVLVRVPGVMSNLPRMLYGVLEASQEPLDWHVQGQSQPLTRWTLTLQEVEPQSIDLVVTFYSYAYWQSRYATYTAANTAYGSSTYINAVRNPPL